MENLNEIFKTGSSFVDGLRVGEFDSMKDNLRDLSEKSSEFIRGYKSGWQSISDAEIKNDIWE